MTLFEVMSALSATFALGIPTFMEKVMRPKYEERFSEFSKARRDAFIDEFEKALPKVKQSKEEMTPETIETMESLFNEWGQVKADENKLTTLLKYRKYFFVGWFFACAVSLLSIQYMDILILQDSSITLGQFSIGFFCLMLGISIWYGYELFVFDERLSKTKTRTTGEPFGKTESIASSLTAYREAEQMVKEALGRFGIPCTQEALIRAGPVRARFDFLIPNEKAPKYAIEVKSSIVTTLGFHQRISMYKELKKNRIPLTTILVSDLSTARPIDLRRAKEGFDFLVDFQNLDKLKEIIKL